MFYIFNTGAIVVVVGIYLHGTYINAQPFYRVVGGTVDLSPSPVNEIIYNVAWKHGSDIAMEAFGRDLVYYRDFKDRCEFNLTTGVLTIRNLTLSDSGTYKAELNSKDAIASQELKVLNPVPKPTVSVEYNKDKTSCNLICGFTTTPEMGHVVQTWVVDGLDKPDTGSMSVADETDGNEFRCLLKNRASKKSSDAVPNPLKRETGNVGLIARIIAGVMAGVFVVILILLLMIIMKTNWLDNSVIHDLRQWELRKCTCTGKQGGHGGEEESGTQNSSTVNGKKTSQTTDVTIPLGPELLDQEAPATEETNLLKEPEALNQDLTSAPKTSHGPSNSSETPEQPDQIEASADVRSSPESDSSDTPELPGCQGVAPAADESCVNLMDEH